MVGSACPAGYEPLTLGEWEGVHGGCICSNGKTYDKSECDSKKNCKVVAELDKLPIDNLNGQRVCGKKVSVWKRE